MRRGALLLMLCLGACATGAPAPPSSRLQGGQASTSAHSAQQARRAPDPAAAASSAPWRVATDGITACADPAVLRMLREAPADDAAALRRLAAARVRGGCVTAFRTGSWRLVEQSGPLVRLAPAEGGGPLYFWRDEVTEDRRA